MPQSGITDFQRGQLKSACLKLQPIKLTVLFNSAWAELSNTNCTMSVQVHTGPGIKLVLECSCVHLYTGYKRMGWHHHSASFWLVAAEAALS